MTFFPATEENVIFPRRLAAIIFDRWEATRSTHNKKEITMSTTMRTIPSANSTGAPYVAGNFGPLKSEVTAFDLEVIGNIPEELTGRFFRTGPNPANELDEAGLVRYHWFSGTGMVHGLRLRGGKAEWFRSRFILDRDAAKALNRKPLPGPGEGVRDGNVNTNLISVGGKLYMVVEAGPLPVELDYELTNIGRSDFGGTLEAGFSGHPKFDPITGEHHVLAYEPFQPVRYITVDRDGHATTRARIDLPHIPHIHDMAFTQSFIIVPDFPVTFQPENSHTDFPWLWDERRDARIGLLPRNGDVSGIQWFEVPRSFAFHFANAYDDGDLTIIDLPKHPKMFFTDQNGPNEGAPILVRWTLHRPTGKVTETVLDDRGNEFPRINGRLGGQAHRYIYTAHWGKDVEFGPAMKHDVERQTTEVHDYGRGRMTSEPVFVRKPEATAEDEGWILSSVYDTERDLSDIVILDAQDFAGDPVATIRLPVRVPFTFHGGWAPDKAFAVE
jgi:carotenoid cleavage dioxygenase-like enzyme